MYVEQRLAESQHAERLKQAHEERIAQQAAELRRLVVRQRRAERELISTWRRLDELRSTLGTAN